jgi:hypothetical protein
MSRLYYEGLRLLAYPVVMQNSSFVVKSDLDRWGQQAEPDCQTCGFQTAPLPMDRV